MDALHGLLGFVFNTELLSQYGWRLLSGVRITAEVVLLSCSIGFVLATLICRARTSRNVALRGLAAGYIAVFRGTPLLCQLYLVYYGAGEVRPWLTGAGVWWFFRDAFYCCILAFSLNTAAYQAEILRGALGSVLRGQREAAAALGLSPYRAARHVVWPQAFLAALRPLGNELILVIKASALAAIVTLLDLMGQTRLIFARTFDFSVYLYAALIYLAVTEGIRRLWNRMERAASKHVRQAEPPEAAKPAPRRGGMPIRSAEAVPPG